jgi:hypothetical protein
MHEALLVHLDLESWPLGVCELLRCRGFPPRRFFALMPIPEQEEGNKEKTVHPRIPGHNVVWRKYRCLFPNPRVIEKRHRYSVPLSGLWSRNSRKNRTNRDQNVSGPCAGLGRVVPCPVLHSGQSCCSVPSAALQIFRWSATDAGNVVSPRRWPTPPRPQSRGFPPRRFFALAPIPEQGGSAGEVASVPSGAITLIIRPTVDRSADGSAAAEWAFPRRQPPPTKRLWQSALG